MATQVVPPFRFTISVNTISVYGRKPSFSAHLIWFGTGQLPDLEERHCYNLRDALERLRIRALKEKMPQWVVNILPSNPTVAVIEEIWGAALCTKHNRRNMFAMHLTVSRIRPNRFLVELLLRGTNPEFRHHGGWHNLAKFQKTGGLMPSLGFLRDTLRNWTRWHSFPWRLAYHILHPASRVPTRETIAPP